MADKKRAELSYIEKVWLTVGIVAFVAILVLIARVTFSVLLSSLAGCLIAIYFHGLADVIQKITKWKRVFCMLLSTGATLIIVAVLFWFMGSKIAAQIAILSDSLPHTLSNLKEQLGQTPLGRKLLQGVSGGNPTAFYATASQFFSTTFGVLGNLYIILFLGIFFTANPSLYKDGIILLIPADNKPLVKTIIDRISLSLKGWLKSTMLSMVLIAILLPIGLTIVGVPVALVLGLITAILVIVPNFGSFAAMIPGVLLALTISPTTAVIVALIYIGVQTLVGNVIAPVIQSRMINLPPALTIIAQLVMAALGGVMGIVMAIPLLAIAMILVDELYVKRITPVKVDE